MLIKRSRRRHGPELLHAKTRESLGKTMKSVWHHVPGFPLIGIHSTTQNYWSRCYFYHFGIAEVHTLNFCPDRHIFKVGFAVSRSPLSKAVLAYELVCLTVWITTCPPSSRLTLYGEAASEWNRERGRRNEQLARSAGTVPRRGRGEGKRGSRERGQVQHHILPVRWL